MPLSVRRVPEWARRVPLCGRRVPESFRRGFWGVKETKCPSRPLFHPPAPCGGWFFTSSPGYIPDTNQTPPPTSTTKTRRTNMPKSDYIKKQDGAFSAQMTNFKTNIGSYATIVGVTTDQITAQAKDADYFEYILACLESTSNTAKQWTSCKDLMREGGTPPPAGMPVAPVFPTTVVAVAAGIERRFRELVKQIKSHPNYNESIGQALGIEGATHAAPDYVALKPELTLTLNGSAVDVGWGWLGHSAFLDMIELQVDRGDGKGFVMLAYDTTPGYTDTTPHPATPAKWTYRGIYRVNDQRVGQWSNEVSITVVQ